jgi:hypothetical protein
MGHQLPDRQLPGRTLVSIVAVEGLRSECGGWHTGEGRAVVKPTHGDLSA